ncbi:MAG TPA: hypothetical protein VGK94_15380 [Candidatus Polarisedimenticolia bacterium]|jgi:hypothetical protein
MRLGEVLVKRGIITDKELAKALDAQLIFGAHLGTCLIELGYIDEESLGNLLGETFKVRYATRELLQKIPDHVVKSLTKSVVEKHQAIPFDLKEKVLHVAMVNPRHLPSLDELSFVSGCRIEAWVAPEVRIVQAMERYYDVPRRLRYIHLANQLDEEQKPRKEAGKASSPKKAAMAVMKAQAAATQAGPRIGRADRAVREADTEERSEIWPADGRLGRAKGPSTAPKRQEGLAGVSEELCRADDGARIAKVALNHAARGMARCILFEVKAGVAAIRDSRGLNLDPDRVRNIRFPITSDSILGLLCGERFYRGPVPDEPRCRAFLDALGGTTPSEILIIPLYREDRIAAFLYGDTGETGRIQGETEEYLKLVRMVALAIDLVILKKKIHSA